MDRITQALNTDGTGSTVTTTYTWDKTPRRAQKANLYQAVHYTWRDDAG